MPTYDKTKTEKLKKKAKAAGFASLNLVELFQRAYGIEADLDVGPDTKRKLVEARNTYGKNLTISLLITKKNNSSKVKTAIKTHSNKQKQEKAQLIRSDWEKSRRPIAPSDNTRNTQAVQTAEHKFASVRLKLLEEKARSERTAKVQKIIETLQLVPEALTSLWDLNNIINQQYSFPTSVEELNALEDLRYIDLIRSLNPEFTSNMSNKEILKEREEILKGRNNPYINFSLGTQPFNPSWHSVHENLYPYSYSLDGGDTSLLGKAQEYIEMKRKFNEAEKGMDPKRAAFNEFLDLDLNNPKDYKRARELSKYFTNLDTSNLYNLQKKFRVRQDYMDMHDGITPRYGMFKINPEYISNTARDAKVPTWVYSDEEMRRLDLEEMAAYLATNPTPSKTEGDLDFYEVTGDPYVGKGRYTIVRERNPDGTTKQVRYVDTWDYKYDDVVGKHNLVVTGDTIPTNYRQFGGRKTSVKKTKS